MLTVEIPVAIRVGENDHQQPVAGDHGIRFASRTDEEVADLRSRAADSTLLDRIRAERAPAAR
jgi:hypothetical protein